MIKKEAAEKVKRIKEPSMDKVFERTLAKLRPEISGSKECKMLCRFLSHLAEKPS